MAANNDRTQEMATIPDSEGLLPDDLTIVEELNKRRTDAGMVPLFGPASPVDLEGYARAQTAFIQAQIRFYSPRLPGDHVFLEELTAFSKAQTELIKAQYRLIGQVGIL